MPINSKLWPVIGILLLELTGCSLLPAAKATLAPAALPTQYLEFSDLSAVQKAARFPIWLPGFVPNGLPFYHAWISDYGDGSEKVRV